MFLGANGSLVEAFLMYESVAGLSHIPMQSCTHYLNLTSFLNLLIITLKAFLSSFLVCTQNLLPKTNSIAILLGGGIFAQRSWHLMFEL